jgi:hypothetical protein
MQQFWSKKDKSELRPFRDKLARLLADVMKNMETGKQSGKEVEIRNEQKIWTCRKNFGVNESTRSWETREKTTKVFKEHLDKTSDDILEDSEQTKTQATVMKRGKPDAGYGKRKMPDGTISDSRPKKSETWEEKLIATAFRGVLFRGVSQQHFK